MIGEIAAIGGPLIGGMIGASQAESAREQARQLIQQSIDEYQRIGIPSAEAMQLSLEKYRSAGILTPELEQNILQGQTELKGIETDPRLMDAQMQALDELRTRGQGGFSIGDRASLQKGLDAAAVQEKGQRDAILQDMQQRGASTSGGSLAAQLLNQQGSAGRTNQAALDTAAQGYQNALSALREGGQLAGNIQQQQFGQKAQVASAQDIINQMNTQAMQGVQQRNVGSQNAAQQYNLGNQQNLMNANVDLGNQQQVANKNAFQQYYQNQMQKAGQMSNARSGQANNVMQGGQAAAQMWGGLGSGVGQAAAGLQQNYNTNQWNQKNMENQNAENEKNRQAYLLANKGK